MDGEIVGRQAELADVHDFVDETLSEPAALVLEGDAGIGKSTLWLARVDHAPRQGTRGLLSRPPEAARGLRDVRLPAPFATLPARALPVCPPAPALPD